MSNAYLILAHNEFNVLQELVDALDQQDNTLFIHYDTKVQKTPTLISKHADLIVLQEREDIYWGHISIVKAQFRLWEAAVTQGKFDAYHLISGVHYPLVSHEMLYDYLRDTLGKCIFSPMASSIDEVNHKMKRYHFFVKYFHHKKFYIRRLSHYSWLVLLKLQKIFKIQRFNNDEFSKSSQWHILTHEAVEYLISIKSQIEHKYRFTFCPDEYFVLTEINHSQLRDSIKFDNRLLLTDFINVSPKLYSVGDFDYLINSGYLFARKFSGKDLQIIEKLKLYNAY